MQDPEHPHFCLDQPLQRPTVWLGIFLGGFVTLLLMLYRVRGAIIIGILLVSIISWPRPTSVTYFPYTPMGDASFDFFRQVVALRPIRYVGNAIDYNYGNGKLWLALITFLYVDLMDTTGTLYSMARFSGVMNSKTGDFERSTVAYCVDAFSISIGALMGTSPVTAYIESATGIAEGGKTGLTAIVTAFCFFISIFFAPIFASIPPWATGGALVIAGSLMMKNVTDINWLYIGDAFPAFLTLIIIPFTFNIAYGLIAGICSMLILKTLPWAIAKATSGRLVPGNYDLREQWIVPSGGLIPPWMRKLSRGQTNIWADDDDDDQVGDVPAEGGTLPTHQKEQDSSEKFGLEGGPEVDREKV